MTPDRTEKLSNDCSRATETHCGRHVVSYNPLLVATSVGSFKPRGCVEQAPPPDMSSRHLRCGFCLMLQIKGEAPSLREAINPSLARSERRELPLLALLLGNTLNFSVLHIAGLLGADLQIIKSSIS